MALAITGSNQIHLIFSFFLLLTGLSYFQTDKLLQGQVLKDGDELVSVFGNFRLGFFSPHGTANRYLGIWYKRPADRTAWYSGEFDDKRYITGYTPGYSPGCYGDEYKSETWPDCQKINLKPLWVANRNYPFSGYESPSLTIDSTDGNLKILRNEGNPIAISSVPRAGNTSASLLKNGNLVLNEMNSNGSIRRELWKSFDYPTDTLLPGMKLGINLETGQQRFLQSWSNYRSPSNGSYVLGMGLNITNKLIIWRDRQLCRKSGLLKNRSSSSSFLGPSLYNFSYTANEQGRYLNYSVNEDVTSFPLLRINAAGEVEDDTGRDILCTAFGGCEDDWSCPNPNYNDSPISRG